MFDCLKKYALTRSILKALVYYETTEALALVQAHRDPDQAYIDHFAGKSHGWVLSYP